MSSLYIELEVEKGLSLALWGGGVVLAGFQ